MKTNFQGGFGGCRGFSLAEMVFAVLVVGLGFTSTVTMLTFNNAQNKLEQERSRAQQLVTQEMENVRATLFSRVTGGRTVTIWDNGTPGDTTDDTTGSIEVEIRNPANGAVLTAAPVPARIVQIEVTMTWNPRGRYFDRTYRESVMSYIVP